MGAVSASPVTTTFQPSLPNASSTLLVVVFYPCHGAPNVISFTFAKIPIACAIRGARSGNGMWSQAATGTSQRPVYPRQPTWLQLGSARPLNTIPKTKRPALGPVALIRLPLAISSPVGVSWRAPRQPHSRPRYVRPGSRNATSDWRCSPRAQ